MVTTDEPLFCTHNPKCTFQPSRAVVGQAGTVPGGQGELGHWCGTSGRYSTTCKVRGERTCGCSDVNGDALEAAPEEERTQV